MKLWDEYALEQAKNVLSQSTTVTEAAEKLAEVLGRPVSKDSLRKAFGTYGLNSPSNYLNDIDLEFDVDRTRGGVFEVRQRLGIVLCGAVTLKGFEGIHRHHPG